MSNKFSRRGKSRLKSYYMDFDNHDCSDICDCSSRSPTPRFIVDRQGAIRWPPFKITNEGGSNDENKSYPEQTDDVGIENFTLKKPQTLTEPSTSVPRVLGWLQVNSDSHVFTPALAHAELGAGGDTREKDKGGPFKKAPFHSNMHVLQTKI